MPYPPGQDINVRNNGVGLAAGGLLLPLVVGVTTAGTVNTLYTYADPQQLLSELTSGPAVELALPQIDVAGGVHVLKTASSTAGANGAVTATRVGTSTGTITLAGTPLDNYLAKVKITKTGALGVGRFRYTLGASTLRKDDAYDYSEEITIPAGGTYAIPGTGITATFVPGGGPTIFELGDSHTWTSTAPHYTTSDLSAAITALLAQLGTYELRKVGFAGWNASAAGAATMAAAIATHATTLEGRFQFVRCMMDGGKDTSTNVKSSMSAFADDRVAVTFGNADISGLSGIVGMGGPQYPLLNAAFERAVKADLSENLGRFESGPLRGVMAISHDEDKLLAFSEADKIITARTWPSTAGFYITNGYLKSPSGSDFLYWDWGTTIDEICSTTYHAQQKWILAKLRSLVDGTGRLDPRDANRIANVTRAALARAVGPGPEGPTNIEGYNGHVSGIAYSVNQSNDYLSTRTTRGSVAAVPLSPNEQMVTDIGFARSL